eukprot:c9650_g1_i4.p1 GENE.c9650_g1_i4~~c9650_g1_i4.p1  ORF type:complete len:107 (-),score=8.20 c9650_g1_i4:4-324(-)
MYWIRFDCLEDSVQLDQSYSRVLTSGHVLPQIQSHCLISTHTHTQFTQRCIPCNTSNLTVVKHINVCGVCVHGMQCTPDNAFTHTLTRSSKYIHKYFLRSANLCDV